MAFLPLGRGTISKTPFSIRESISLLIAASHLSRSGPLIASLYVCGSDVANMADVTQTDARALAMEVASSPYLSGAFLVLVPRRGGGVGGREDSGEDRGRSDVGEVVGCSSVTG